MDYLGSSPLLSNDTTGDKSAGDNYYNDVKHYVTIKITTKGNGTYEYTFRYYGADEDWKTSATSELFICYAYDQYNKGGSEGNGKVTKEMAKQFTSVFETEFVNKVDKELSLQHTVDE